MSELRNVCVYAGSQVGARSEYRRDAVRLGRVLAEQGIGVVYGGARAGLMGALADAALAAGGHVTGVIPWQLVEREVAHEGLPDLRVVGSMHERKALMAELSDAFVALPGGIGTLEELIEMFTWAQLGVHRSSVGLLNVAGYYDRLIAFFDHATREGFLRERTREMLVIEADPARLVEKLRAFEAPDVPQWIDRTAS
jgi:uncharacterized protein (TIGR00730 family)